MLDYLNKLKVLSAELDKKDHELTTLILKYKIKRTELYKERNAGKNVDEPLIKNLEFKNNKLLEYQVDIMDKLDCIKKSIDDLEQYMDELNLDDFHNALD